MQPLKSRFQTPDGTGHGNIQYCVRTNDIDEVGDGTHLTFFQMVGSFGFGTNNYGLHIDLWSSILSDLNIHPDTVHVHPESEHGSLWQERGWGDRLVDDRECQWSDGNVGGYCSELFVGELEIGNLVNPMGHSVDVGFGFERLLQVLSGVSRVDETELFRQDLDPVSRDHFRTLTVFHEQGITPGNKGRNYVCRRLLRRFLRLTPHPTDCSFGHWIESERLRLDKALKEGRRFFRRNPDKPPVFWWDTFGILPEELYLLQY